MYNRGDNSIQSFGVDKTGRRLICSHNENLETHFVNIPDNKYIASSLERIKPVFIIEFTAIPAAKQQCFS
jgi:hypothetical protein